MYVHSEKIIKSGSPLSEAKTAIIMLHGRGASAESINSLGDHLNLNKAAILAPQATNHSWYPYSFIAPIEENQPALNSALNLINSIVEDVVFQGIDCKNIYFLGFSQGACLAIEYITRHATYYGGAIIFTGGLIGEHLDLKNYIGDFAQTPILVTTGDPDSHVPLSRIEESVAVLEKLNANVTLKIFTGRPHTIIGEEIELANDLVLNERIKKLTSD